jgi:hypothetical protein
MFGITLAIIIKYYCGFSEYEYIWFCSKILTVKKMVSKISTIDRVFSNFESGSGERLYFTNLLYVDYLKRIKDDGTCKNGYKTCGILDTYGNKFCLSPATNCPINKMIIDLSSKNSQYGDYQQYSTEYSGLSLYCKSNVLDSGIIASWIIEDSPPKYINDNNFIIDMDAFNECFKDDDDKDDDDDDDDDDGNKGNELWQELAQDAVDGAIDAAEQITKNAIKLGRIMKLIKHIEEKMNEEENIDKNYTYINQNHYVKNYMGFKNLEAIENFNKIDFSVYKKRFPNYASVALSISILIIFVIFIVILTIYFIKNRTIDIDRYFLVIFVIIYVVSFLYLFIYSIVIFARDFRKETFKVAKSIRADKFIEDFLKEFYEPFDKATFIICIIVFLIISALFFILFWVIEPISYCIR